MRINYKTPKGIIQGLNIKFARESAQNKSYTALELHALFSEVLKRFNFVETQTRVRLDSWKGKSSLQIIEKPDKFIIITYQKPDKDKEPVEERTEVTKEEMNCLIESLNVLSYNLDNDKTIPTENIAANFCNRMEMKENHKKEPLFDRNLSFIWSHFFAWRFWHNKLTKMLRALDYYGSIKYRGGRTQILEKPLSMQLSF